jgi:hypothetical protein
LKLRKSVAPHTIGIDHLLTGWGEKIMLSRAQRLLALFFCITLGSCGNIRTGDWLWWPGFDTVTAAYTYQIPVHDMALEVQCEIYDFLKEESEKLGTGKPKHPLLDPMKGAGVSLALQTDLSGSVQYVGINLSKLGFSSLSELVTQTSKTPSLQAKASGKATTSAQVDFAVAQTQTLRKENQAKCEQRRQDPLTSLKYEYLKLWLSDWLSKYSLYQKNVVEGKPGEAGEPFVCAGKVTLKSQFLIGVDVSAGVNAFMTPPIILPISGVNVDGNPDYTHSIQITLALQDPGKDAQYPTIGPEDSAAVPKQTKLASTPPQAASLPNDIDKLKDIVIAAQSAQIDAQKKALEAQAKASNKTYCELVQQPTPKIGN